MLNLGCMTLHVMALPLTIKLYGSDVDNIVAQRANATVRYFGDTAVLECIRQIHFLNEMLDIFNNDFNR